MSQVAEKILNSKNVEWYAVTLVNSSVVTILTKGEWADPETFVMLKPIAAAYVNLDGQAMMHYIKYSAYTDDKTFVLEKRNIISCLKLNDDSRKTYEEMSFSLYDKKKESKIDADLVGNNMIDIAGESLFTKEITDRLIDEKINVCGYPKKIQ